jgi:tRNA-(ms[2]io[6]A)-hydroxylase
LSDSILKAATPTAWVDTVLANFDEFLNDHASNERKASAAAMSMIAHYPDKAELLSEMVDLALEELSHYRQVLKLMLENKQTPSPDEKDPYVNQLLKHIRNVSVRLLYGPTSIGSGYRSKRHGKVWPYRRASPR